MKFVVFFLFLFFSYSLQAENLGIFGETFDIEEEDLLKRILSELQALHNKGKLRQLTIEANKRIKSTISQPRQVQEIAYTEVKKIYFFDPSIVVTRDLADHRGVIFAHKGERFNPLDEVSMRPLIFIDGDNKDHIKWAVTKLSDSEIYRHEQGKIVLVKGSPLDLQKQLKREIYFDQLGLLSGKLKIKHVPAIVYQKPNEKVLTIIEDLP